MSPVKSHADLFLFVLKRVLLNFEKYDSVLFFSHETFLWLKIKWEQFLYPFKILLPFNVLQITLNEKPFLDIKKSD